CDAQVHEAGHRVPGLVVDDRDVGLVGSGATAWVHDHPRVGELDHARVLLQHNLAAEDLGIERTGPSNASYGDEVCDEEALARGRQVLEVDRWRVLAHGSASSYARGFAVSVDVLLTEHRDPLPEPLSQSDDDA